MWAFQVFITNAVVFSLIWELSGDLWAFPLHQLLLLD